MEAKKVWFVTGASKGLGLALVRKLLANGYRVAATSRNKQALTDQLGPASDAFLPLEVNLSDNDDVHHAIEKSVAQFGKIDVVVNNAGYAQFGTPEELTDEEIRQNFEINVFGLLNVTRNVMPHLRARKSGHIINMASIGGFTGAFPGAAIYCATKFAVAGLTEALSADVKEFGISATVVYPGYFRTNFLDKGSLRLPKNQIKEYTASANLAQWHANEQNGHQPGDPQKAAAAFKEVAEMEKPPLHLFLGSDSLQLAQEKIEVIQNALREHQALSTSTDFLTSSENVEQWKNNSSSIMV